MRVLVIEGQPPLVPVFRQSLDAEGFAVDVARTGAEGDYKARTASYDAILLDLLLPGEDGLGLLRGWRQSGLRSQVLVLTRDDDLDERVLSLDLGADDSLPRPFQLAELLARLR